MSAFLQQNYSYQLYIEQKGKTNTKAMPLLPRNFSKSTNYRSLDNNRRPSSSSSSRVSTTTQSSTPNQQQQQQQHVLRTPPTMMDLVDMDVSRVLSPPKYNLARPLSSSSSRPHQSAGLTNMKNQHHDHNNSILSSTPSSSAGFVGSAVLMMNISAATGIPGASSSSVARKSAQNLSMAEQTSKRLKNFQSVAAETSFIAGHLVADTIVPQKSKQEHQQNEVSNFKFDVCTPRRQQQQQRFLFSSSNDNHNATTARSVQFADSVAGNNKNEQQKQQLVPSPPNRALQHQQQLKTKQGTGETIDSVNSQIETFVMSFASEQQRYDRRRNDLEKAKAKQRAELGLPPASPMTTALSSSNVESDSTNKGKPTSSSINNNNRRRRGSSTLSQEQLQKQQQQGNNASSSSTTIGNLDGDDDDKSSTDSAIIDPTVVTAVITRNSQRRANRLRDHFSASLDTLNQTAANANQLVLSSAAVSGGAGGDSACVLMSYLVGLERLVQFAFNTLGSKDELQAVVEALSSLAGLAETAQSFGRWACFTKESLSNRLEKVLPVKFDRYALFDTLGGVLRDGRVIHSCLLAGLRLMYFAPSPPHFIEFVLTILFVHQSSLSQADCQTLYRMLTTPHPLRFLVRGRQDNTVSFMNSVRRTFSSRNRNINSAFNSANQPLYSAACDVDRRVAGEELYYLVDFLSTATTLPGSGGCTISWGDLQRLVSPLTDDELQQQATIVAAQMSQQITGGSDSSSSKDQSSSSQSSAKFKLKSLNTLSSGSSTAITTTTYANGEEKPLSSTEKEEERKREQAKLLQRKHDVAMEARRKAARGDVFAANTNKRRNPTECVIFAKLMSEMKNP